LNGKTLEQPFFDAFLTGKQNIEIQLEEEKGGGESKN
jgi:hypothetical protein